MGVGDGAREAFPEKMLQRSRTDLRMQKDTIQLYLEKGWSLAVCCCHCPRIVEWAPPDLAEGFASKLDTTISAVLARVACKGEGGCGSKNVALFPHAYDHAWTTGPNERCGGKLGRRRLEIARD